MAWRRALLIATLLILAVVIELTVLAPLPWWGATPPLVLVVVAGVALSFGPITGAVAGFAGGLLLDFAPPALTTVGIAALILTVLGYGLGRIFDSDERPLWLTTVVTALAAGISVLATAALGGLLGDVRVRWDDVPGFLAAVIVYAAFLSLPCVPGIRALSRRVVPEAFPR